MPLMPPVGRKSFKGRAFTLFLYTVLTLMGVTMIVPFMISISSSTTNDFDYNRFRPVPRYFHSTTDRFVKGLVYYFNTFRNHMSQFRTAAPELPVHWTSWTTIGNDTYNVDAFANRHLDHAARHPEQAKRLAADYFEFANDYPLEDSVVTVINPQAVWFMADYYTNQLLRERPESADWSRSQRRAAALELISTRWGLPYESFYSLSFESELNLPLHFQGFFPNITDPKYQDFMRLKQAYRSHLYTPGVGGKWADFLAAKGYRAPEGVRTFPLMDNAPDELRKLWTEFASVSAPASPCTPFALRAAWYSWLRSDRALRLMDLPDGAMFDITQYNRLAETDYTNLEDTPFPIPAQFPEAIQKVWKQYVATQWPLRLTRLKVDDKLRADFAAFVEEKIRHINVANQLLSDGEEVKDWKDFPLYEEAPGGSTQIGRNRRGNWRNFAAQTPVEVREVRSSETLFQDFLRSRYGTLAAVNDAYGWNLKYWEEAFPPFMPAYAQTFIANEGSFATQPVFENYAVIIDYLFMNSQAVLVTVVLIVLVIFLTLTVNPIAAYALSRFRIRGKPLFILFMLSTMAFPAMVSAIPAYLLMRDLGFLNTFAALVLPGAANGMAIFILKGFFDSLPPELFEAATIDGASEFQVFRIVAMPMVKPILAINCLNAFIAAYNGWEWALIICQKQSMWTIAVWMYQATTWWVNMPWVVMAGFVVTSIPTMIVFISCQKVIMRGIVLPAMK